MSQLWTSCGPAWWSLPVVIFHLYLENFKSGFRRIIQLHGPERSSWPSSWPPCRWAAVGGRSRPAASSPPPPSSSSPPPASDGEPGSLSPEGTVLSLNIFLINAAVLWDASLFFFFSSWLYVHTFMYNSKQRKTWKSPIKNTSILTFTFIALQTATQDISGYFSITLFHLLIWNNYFSFSDMKHIY